MKNVRTTTATIVILATLFSCKKNHSGLETSAETATMDSRAELAVNDTISVAATQKVPGKKFVKTATVNMEVKDVYDATIKIEKNLKEIGGFVTQSHLQSQVISENTYETSDTEAVLVKKYWTENKMQVRVPTDRLGEFLTAVNEEKIFWNQRSISAEDVTNNAAIARLEMERLQKTNAVAGQMKNTGEKVEKIDDNLSQQNAQKIANMQLADDLKYSTIDIYIKEPKLRVIEIPVTNPAGVDNKYRFNFLHDARDAFANGFYIVQKLGILLITLWPFVVPGVLFLFLYLKRKKQLALKQAQISATE